MLVAAGSLAYICTLSIVRGVKTEETWPKVFFFFFLLQPLSARTSPSFRLKCKQVLHNSVVVTRQQPLPSAEQGREGAGPCACGRACVPVSLCTVTTHTFVSAESPRSLKCNW